MLEWYIGTVFEGLDRLHHSFWYLYVSHCFSNWLCVFCNSALVSLTSHLCLRRPRAAAIAPYSMDMQSCCATPIAEWWGGTHTNTHTVDKVNKNVYINLLYDLKVSIHLTRQVTIPLQGIQNMKQENSICRYNCCIGCFSLSSTCAVCPPPAHPQTNWLLMLDFRKIPQVQ